MRKIDTQKIYKIMDSAYSQIKEILMNVYPNLYFYISPTGNLSCWVRTQEDRDGAGIEMKQNIHAGSISMLQEKYLEELNELVAPVYNEPDKFFYCTECGQVKPKAEYAESVFAGYYCKECAKKPAVARLIEESHQRGFYD